MWSVALLKSGGPLYPLSAREVDCWRAGGQLSRICHHSACEDNTLLHSAYNASTVNTLQCTHSHLYTQCLQYTAGIVPSSSLGNIPCQDSRWFAICVFCNWLKHKSICCLMADCDCDNGDCDDDDDVCDGNIHDRQVNMLWMLKIEDDLFMSNASMSSGWHILITRQGSSIHFFLTLITDERHKKSKIWF